MMYAELPRLPQRCWQAAFLMDLTLRHELQTKPEEVHDSAARQYDHGKEVLERWYFYHKRQHMKRKS